MSHTESQSFDQTMKLSLLKMLTDNITRTEFKRAFESVVKQILQLEKALLKEHSQISASLQKETRDIFGILKKENNNEFATLKAQTAQKLEKALSAIAEQLEILREKMTAVRNGLDGHTPTTEELTALMTDLLPAIVPPDTPEQVRDKLETLQDSERLSISAIHQLEEKLDALEKRPIGGGKGGGGFSKGHMDGHIVDDETPTGAIDGVNAVFRLANTPAPTGSLKIYVNGQRLRITDDFTLSNRTITLSTAPPVGAVILADYRI